MNSTVTFVIRFVHLTSFTSNSVPSAPYSKMAPKTPLVHIFQGNHSNIITCRILKSSAPLRGGTEGDPPPLFRQTTRHITSHRYFNHFVFNVRYTRKDDTKNNQRRNVTPTKTVRHGTTPVRGSGTPTIFASTAQRLKEAERRRTGSPSGPRRRLASTGQNAEKSHPTTRRPGALKKDRAQ